MGNLNKVMIIGHLGQDPDIRHAPSGDEVANMTVATSESWKDKNGERQEKTEWHRVVAFGKLAEICGQYLQKGSEVYFEGRLQTRKWTDKEGQDRYTTEIVATQLQMLGGKQDRERSEKPAASRSRSGGGAAKHTAPADDEFDDDIPFN